MLRQALASPYALRVLRHTCPPPPSSGRHFASLRALPTPCTGSVSSTRLTRPALVCTLLAVSGYTLSRPSADTDAAPVDTLPPHTGTGKSAPLPAAAPHVAEPEPQDLVNWSGTHAVSTERFYAPETLSELKAIVSAAHVRREKLRPVGSALSPNGLPFAQGGMLSLQNMSDVLAIDVPSARVTVQAGARVSQVVDALRPHGLTLQNYASITEQQVGGFVQVGAHGTGIAIPPVDEQVVSMRIVTPAAGELVLSKWDDDPALFRLARTSLGMLGIVTELTLQCVPAHKLVERTKVLTRAEVVEQHVQLKRDNQHVRYMWIPYTDAVIVVSSNPERPGDVPVESTFSETQRLQAARKLLLSHPKCKFSEMQVNGMGFTTLRDELLAVDGLNVDWVKKINHAEAEFWRRSEGIRIDWSDKVLQFDCGGQQWVSEVAFPVPEAKSNANCTDTRYMLTLLDMIETENIAAPSPIEQRWTAISQSPLSPAGEKPDVDLPAHFCWVGIIMYLPDAELDAVMRHKVTTAFKQFKTLCEKRLWPEVGAVEHWAKIEMPANQEELTRLQTRIYRKYPVEAFRAICSIFDPHGILRNDLTDAIFGMSGMSTDR